MAISRAKMLGRFSDPFAAVPSMWGNVWKRHISYTNPRADSLCIIMKRFCFILFNWGYSWFGFVYWFHFIFFFKITLAFVGRIQVELTKSFDLLRIVKIFQFSFKDHPGRWYISNWICKFTLCICHVAGFECLHLQRILCFENLVQCVVKTSSTR